jgi:hypothetical protein
MKYFNNQYRLFSVEVNEKLYPKTPWGCPRLAQWSFEIIVDINVIDQTI